MESTNGEKIMSNIVYEQYLKNIENKVALLMDKDVRIFKRQLQFVYSEEITFVTALAISKVSDKNYLHKIGC